MFEVGFIPMYAQIPPEMSAALSQLKSSTGSIGSVATKFGSGSGITSPVTGSIVAPGPKHSVILSTPPLSQSNVAIFDVGFIPIKAQIPPEISAALSQLKSSAGSVGSAGTKFGSGSGIASPVTGSIVNPGPKHSVILSTPPISQSAVAIGLVGLVIRKVQMSVPREASSQHKSVVPTPVSQANGIKLPARSNTLPSASVYPSKGAPVANGVKSGGVLSSGPLAGNTTTLGSAPMSINPFPTSA